MRVLISQQWLASLYRQMQTANNRIKHYAELVKTLAGQIRHHLQ